MRKRKAGRKFHRETSQRKALLKSQVQSLVMKEKIKTTEAKAKELRMAVEKAITLGKKKTVQSKRQLAKIFDPETVKKLSDDLGSRYKERPGGYTRIIKLGQRKSDASKMAIIEFVK
jgi:large subunit ribosomal protein L17